MIHFNFNFNNSLAVNGRQSLHGVKDVAAEQFTQRLQNTSNNDVFVQAASSSAEACKEGHANNATVNTASSAQANPENVNTIPDNFSPCNDDSKNPPENSSNGNEKVGQLFRDNRAVDDDKKGEIIRSNNGAGENSNTQSPSVIALVGQGTNERAGQVVHDNDENTGNACNRGIIGNFGVSNAAIGQDIGENAETGYTEDDQNNGNLELSVVAGRPNDNVVMNNDSGPNDTLRDSDVSDRAITHGLPVSNFVYRQPDSGSTDIGVQRHTEAVSESDAGSSDEGGQVTRNTTVSNTTNGSNSIANASLAGSLAAVGPISNASFASVCELFCPNYKIQF